MLKRVLVVLALLAALAVVLATAGASWLFAKVDGFLIPPPDPAGQHGIAGYAESAELFFTASPEAILPAFSWSAIANPPKSARAWTRWWWPGGDVDAPTVAGQLATLDEAGFGGVEVQPFVGGMGAVKNEQVMARVYSFDTGPYYEVLRSGIDVAEKLGMQFDLTHFSGWPPGGSEVNLDDSLTILAYGETEVSAGRGEALSVELPQPGPGPGEYIFAMTEFAGADFINFPAARARLLSVVAARRVAGRHAWNVFNLDDTVTLDPESAQLLTDQVRDGVLHWDAPAGDWTIIASYLMPSGEVPIGAAQKPQGFVVDHLRRPQVIGHYEYAFGARTGLPAYYGKGLRGFFNDSLEFRLRRMSVGDILEEFKARRGYDLAPYLPAVYIEGVDNVYFAEILGIRAAPEFRMTTMDDRIRHDYQQTLSDLVIERFVETSADWARARNLVSRGQSYGLDIDIIRALGANTIPETEQLWAGGADIGLKFASSAAALYGRNLVSAESFVWINRDYMPTARRLKAAADKLFLAGINHIVYHGTPYPWQGGAPGPFGEEGWAPFSGPENPGHFSGNVSPGNSALWPDVPALNRYIARSQNLLRQGHPVVDVLIYYPYLGFHGPNPEAVVAEALVGGALADADPQGVPGVNALLSAGKAQLDRLLTVPPAQTDPRAAWVQQVQPLLQALDRSGISWGWVNDHALQGGALAGGRLTASGGTYRAIVLPNVDAIEKESLAALQRQVDDGVPVFLSGSHPQRQPGFMDAAAGDPAVRQAVAALLEGGAGEIAFTPQAWLSALAALPGQSVHYREASAIQRYRRLLADGGAIHFFGNQGAAYATLHLEVPGDRSLWWFDAVEGVAWPAGSGTSTLDVTLAGFESRFLVEGVPLPAGLAAGKPALASGQVAARRWPLERWHLTVGEYTADLGTLLDWRDMDQLRHARGPGVYHHEFELDSKLAGARYLLDLGLVQGSSSVTVNGTEIGRASLPPFRVDITDALTPGSNRIDIAVLAPLRNYFVGRALAGDLHYSGMEAYRDQLVAAGLLGPVALLELAANPDTVPSRID